MKVIISLILCYFIQSASFSQQTDSALVKKWISHATERFQSGTDENWNRLFITKKQDTLERHFEFLNSTIFGSFVTESNSVNGKLNGPFIVYHSNGRIYSIRYFLDDKLWETNVLMDSSGNQHPPGTMVNGTGVVPFMGEDGQDLGFATYKNGNTDGKYYEMSKEDSVVTEGVLSYGDKFWHYDTITKIHYINERKDSMTAVLWNGKGNDSVSLSYLANKDCGEIKFLDKEDYIQVGSEGRSTELDIYLMAGVVPVGEWKVHSLKRKRTLYSFGFDKCGKLLSLIDYRNKKMHLIINRMVVMRNVALTSRVVVN